MATPHPNLAHSILKPKKNSCLLSADKLLKFQRCSVTKREDRCVNSSMYSVKETHEGLDYYVLTPNFVGEWPADGSIEPLVAMTGPHSITIIR